MHEGTQNEYGAPLDKALDPDTEGWWKVRWSEDFAAKAVRESREDAADDELKDSKPVVFLDPDYKPRSATAND